jgi:hypothetical protein
MRDDYEERNRVSSFRGYLYKMRRSPNLLAPQWGKRWFSIEGHFLRWYRHDSDLCAAGMINLKYVRNILKLDHYGQLTFSVSSDERTLVLRCATLNEMTSWIRALHKQADIARGGTGMTVVSDFNSKPLDSSSIKYSRKQGKSRTSLTLEEEIDLTLQKLTELELTVQLADDEMEPKGKRTTGTRIRHSEDSKDQDDDDLDDSFSAELPVRFAKAGSRQPSFHVSAAAPSKGPNNGNAKNSTVGEKKKSSVEINRILSSGSIEELNLATMKVRPQRPARNGAQHREQNNSYPDEIVLSDSTGREQMESFDEFDFAAMNEQLPPRSNGTPAKHGGGKSTTTPQKGKTGTSKSKENRPRSKRSESSESLEFAEELDSPDGYHDIVPRSRSSNNNSNYATSSAGTGSVGKSMGTGSNGFLGKGQQVSGSKAFATKSAWAD